MNPLEICAAHARISAHLRRTPVMQIEAGACGLPASLAAGITFKLSLLQQAGNFERFLPGLYARETGGVEAR